MKFFLYSIALIAIIGFGALKLVKPAHAEKIELGNKNAKVLIVYYSQSTSKNTETLANYINQSLDSDMYKIELVTPYPEKYKKVVAMAKEQNENNILPALKPTTVDVSEYDIIFIGSPIWFGTYAPPIGTFLSENNLQGKTIVPFCTHGGGGAGTLYKDLSEKVPNATIIEKGFIAKGSNVVERFFGYGTKNKVSQEDISNWLKEIL